MSVIKRDNCFGHDPVHEFLATGKIVDHANNLTYESIPPVVSPSTRPALRSIGVLAASII